MRLRDLRRSRDRHNRSASKNRYPFRNPKHEIRNPHNRPPEDMPYRSRTERIRHGTGRLGEGQEAKGGRVEKAGQEKNNRRRDAANEVAFLLEPAQADPARWPAILAYLHIRPDRYTGMIAKTREGNPMSAPTVPISEASHQLLNKRNSFPANENPPCRS